MAGITYSVWNPTRGGFDYYEGAGHLRDGVIAPQPKHLSRSRLGLTPEEAARPLPAGATKIGEGPLPKGLIANRKSGVALGAFGLGGDPMDLAFLGFGVYLLWSVR